LKTEFRLDKKFFRNFIIKYCVYEIKSFSKLNFRLDKKQNRIKKIKTGKKKGEKQNKSKKRKKQKQKRNKIEKTKINQNERILNNEE
jgi:hypothetical protein